MGKSSKIKQRKAEADEAAFQQRFAMLSRSAAAAPQERPLIDEFAAYAPHFVRSPDEFELRTRSSSRAKQVLEMARHLFGRFRVPRVLEQAWGAYLPDPATLPVRRPDDLPLRNRPPVGGNLSTIDFRAWFVCIATGGSLYKSHTKGLLTKKETHAFLAAPPTLSLCQAIVYAVAKCAGACEGSAQRLARSKLSEKRFDEFWFDAVRFFCLPDNLPESVAVVNDLTDYIAHRRREDAAFRLLGSSQSLAAVLRRMEQWHRALARAKDLSGVQWDGVDLPDHEITQKDPENKNHVITWRFHQITTGKELAAEGTAQRHCVFGYKQSCIGGRCSIWSLTRTQQFGSPVRRLTIELTSSGEIVQKRGLANRLPRPEEEHIVEQWARAMGLTNRRGGGW